MEHLKFLSDFISETKYIELRSESSGKTLSETFTEYARYHSLWHTHC